MSISNLTIWDNMHIIEVVTIIKYKSSNCISGQQEHFSG